MPQSGFNQRLAPILCVLCALFLALVPGTLRAAATVSGIEIGGASITLRFDQPVATASAFMLSGPQRIAVDLPGARMGRVSASGGLIAGTRHGQYDNNTARVVFELNRAAIVSDAQTFSDDHQTLTLSLKPVDESLFARAVRKGRQLFGLDDKPVDTRSAQRGGITVPLDPPKPLQVPAVSGVRGTKRPLVIDAGHGGHDPGIAIDRRPLPREGHRPRHRQGDPRRAAGRHRAGSGWR